MSIIFFNHLHTAGWLPLELHRRSLTRGFAGFKVSIVGLAATDACPNAIRKLADIGVVVAKRLVITPTFDSDAIFRTLQLILQRQKVLVGLEVGVVLADYHQPRQRVAQIALGYALAAADSRFVGIDLVAPEDSPVALRDFALHMRMFHYFHSRDPKVRLSLHAGELWLGLVPPAALGYHIRDTVEIAGASRIGHGYELPFESDVGHLLKEMAAKRIAVEINLTSTDVTPGVKGGEHPLHAYMRAGVPWSLSADDEGVFRIDLSHEYVRAVLEQHLTYADLKASARNGITYSFLPGDSLWQPGTGFRKVAECTHTGAACAAFLKRSEKATLQERLEQQFAVFEARAAIGGFTD